MAVRSLYLSIVKTKAVKSMNMRNKDGYESGCAIAQWITLSDGQS